MPRPWKTCFVFGTRPEAIKLAPVISHLQSRDAFHVITLLTAQHREMLDQVVSLFDIPVTHDINIMRPGQTLPALTAALCEPIARVLRDDRPDCVIVQGDTTSCFVGALAAFYEQIPVAHLEAGLRTDNLYQPFPEEMNRRLVSVLTDWHFAATDAARDNLLRENIPPDRIWVTGNSGIDALRIIAERARPVPDGPLAAALHRCHGTVMAVTTHRRENLPFMTGIAAAIYEILEALPDLNVVFPVHLSPRVRESVMPMLRSADRCHLLDPLPYDQFVVLMKRAALILTDSGGIQEEAAYLGKPTLVMRRRTERPEAIAAGNVALVGDDQHDIFDHVLTLLHDKTALAAMTATSQPYGDGHASQRIADILERQLQQRFPRQP
ncbi:MAG: UDP-N-acetylglucosamine 2-epimerase (non-hydrolyzing) [Phycisphaerales bacterium]|nr:UDP-N-acetylglucosamine 2-epimerase (non-hydrolyzing) [Phycisphaerales bacterium]